MMPKPISATVQVKVAICHCGNEASVTMVDDNRNLIQVCPEHHIARFQEMIIDRVKSVLESPELLEILGNIEHERWSGWMEYQNGREDMIHSSGEVFHDRWERQATTSYANLSEAEKESDRIEARKSLAAIHAALLGKEG